LAIACSSASRPQLQLLLRQTLGAGAELHPRQLQQQMAQPVILRQ
jgi:hypothetical protein